MKGDSLAAIINSKSIFALHALQEHWWKEETSPTLEITYWCSEKKGEKKNELTTGGCYTKPRVKLG